jgi:subtilisin family serine protease/uncharacterized membrane protein
MSEKKNKRLFWIVAVFVVSLILLWLLPGRTTASTPLSQGNSADNPKDQSWQEKAAVKIDNTLLAQLQGDPTAPIPVIVRLGGQADLSGAAELTSRSERGAYVYQTLQTFANQRQSAIRTYLAAEQHTGRVLSYRPYFIFNGLAVTAHPATIWQLALRDDVQSITAEQTYTLHQTPNPQPPTPNPSRFTFHVSRSSLPAPEWNITQIHADDVWNLYGVTGQGVLVANIDTGVQYNHPALVNQYAGNLGGGQFDHDFHWYDATSTAALSPFDDNGHGTHTMGTTVGGDGPGPFVNDIGVAPGADWIAVKAFSGDGTGLTSNIHDAFEWILAPCPAGVDPGHPACDPALAPQVVNNSWGNDNSSLIEFLPDVQALRAAGIWPAFSAGNNGPGSGTIGSPASFAESFATGATNNSDLIASFSSRGPSPLTGEIKPDVVAPGVDIRSSLPGSSYGNYNGTSMAGPHATGLAALMLSAAPDLDLDTLEEIIRSTADDLGPAGPDLDYGYGRINALRALQRLLSSGDIAGTVQDATTLAPLDGVTVQAEGQGIIASDTTNLAGDYTLPYLVQSSYTVTTAYYGYEPLTINNVTVITDQVTILDLEIEPLPHYVISGHVYNAVSPTVPITNAVIRALDTPLDPVTVDANGFYSLTVAEGYTVLESAAFSFATGFTATTITADTTIDFYLNPLPPILLVDDDEGDLRNYSPHVQEYYFSALDANGYNYTYWDIEEAGSPDYDTIRQYAAVVWFGGEYGRIKDISDAPQAQAIMDYLNLGGRFFYIAQEHTFYYGDDSPCESPTWGGPGPCPFSKNYLGLADWVEDQKAQVNYGVAGNPVGAGLGPFPMTYPPLFSDLSDDIVGTVQASLAFTATDDLPPGEINLTGYTHISPTQNFKVVYLATPLEGMAQPDAADVMYAVMDWFGVAGLAEGLALAPAAQEDLALPGHTISFTVRLRNLSPFPDTFDLSLLEAPWPAEIYDGTFTNPISQIGPVPSGGTADIGVSVQVPAGAAPGAEALTRLRAVSQSPTPYADEATLLAQARMVYYWRDSDDCTSGVHFDWVDATAGDRWDLDDDGSLPEFVSVPLPAPFTFYNQQYDHLWLNDHATILFGDDNIYDDQFPSENPIPNPTILDPNAGLYLAWGTSFWHPTNQHPDSAVYTYHDPGRNWFIIEYHKYENLLGDGADTMEVILDLNSNEITMQYLTVTYSNFAVAGIENQAGTEGILYVNDQVPAAHILHNGLAVRYGVGTPPAVIEATFIPSAAQQTGAPGTTVDYTLTLSNTSSIADSYDLEVSGNQWPVTFWDPTFTNPLTTIGPLSPCSSAEIGVRVQLPPDTDYVQDIATVRGRSQANTLVAATAVLTTDNAAPAVTAGPDASGGVFSGYPITYTLWITNSGNITDTYDLSLSGYTWPTSFYPPLTQTVELPPAAGQPVVLLVNAPPSAIAGQIDSATLTAASQNYPTTTDSATLTTEILPHRAVNFITLYQEQPGPPNWVLSYFVHVRNEGSLPDAYRLQTVAADWETTLWNDNFTQPLTQTAVLNPNQTQRIGVRVRIPAGATYPDQDAALIHAVSTADEAIAGDTMLVSVVEGQTDMRVTTSGDWQLTQAGTAVTYRLGVSNEGDTADIYTLDVTGDYWPLTAPPTIGPVPPGEVVGVYITVTVPLTATAGQWDELTILVTSTNNPSHADQANLITLLPGQPIPAEQPPPPPPADYRLFLPVIVRK